MDLDTPTHIFVLCGLAAPLVFVATVIAGAAIRPGYTHRGNAVSELIGAGAPNKAALDAAFVLYNLLVIAFGVGVLDAFVDDAPGMRIAGLLLIATGIAGAITWQFPMDPIGAPMTSRGRGHLYLAGFMSLATMGSVLAFAIGAGETPGWEDFATYSYVSLGWIVVTGALAALSAMKLWPTMGLLERLTIGGGLQWMFVLAISMLARPAPTLPTAP